MNSSSHSRDRFRPWHAVAFTLILGGVLIGGMVALWPSAKDARTATAIESVATAAGAFVGLLAAAASAVAAVAAMRAARQSDDTARHAMEALGLAMEPKVNARYQLTHYGGEEHPRTELVVSNPSRWPATDVEIEVRPAFGDAAKYQVERLDPAGTAGEQISFRAPPPPPHPATIDNPEWTGSVEWTDEIVARYSDERGLLRWEVPLGFTYTASNDGKIGGHGQGPVPGFGRPRRLS